MPWTMFSAHQWNSKLFVGQECGSYTGAGWLNYYGRGLGVSGCAMQALGVQGHTPAPVAVYRYGGSLYLKLQPDGQITVTPNSAKAGGLIRSAKLVDLLHKEIGDGKMISVQAFDGGVLLSPKSVPLTEEKEFSRGARIDGELAANQCNPGQPTVVLRTDAIEFSSKTAACMGVRLSLYSSNRALAFVDDVHGGLRPRSSRSRKQINSRTLTRFIKCFFRCGERKDLSVYAETGRVIISESPLSAEQVLRLRWNKVPEEWLGIADDDRNTPQNCESRKQLM